MPTPGAGINTIGVVYETIATDKIRSYGTTSLIGFSIGFELSAADRRYYETSVIKGFGVEFDYNTLNIETIIGRRL